MLDILAYPASTKPVPRVHILDNSPEPYHGLLFRIVTTGKILTASAVYGAKNNVCFLPKLYST